MGQDKYRQKKQDKNAERDFFDELAETGESFKPKPEEEYDIVFRELGMDRNLEGINILEAGCATGEFGSRLAKRGATVHGIDLSPKMIELNRRINKDVKGYTCATGDIEDSELFEPAGFDAAVSFNVLHHFPDCTTVIENLARWIAPGGRIYAEEPNGANITNRLSKLGRSVVKFVFPRMLHSRKLSSENEEHDYTMAEYEEMFARQGFRCIFKNSIVSFGRPNIDGINIISLISVIKWLMYVISGALSFDRMKKGNYLVFIMERKRNDKMD